MQQAIQNFSFAFLVLVFVGVVAALGAMPYAFIRYVSPKKWFWLPIAYGAINGIISLLLFYVGLWSLIGGPLAFGLSLGLLARKNQIRAGAVLVAVLVEIGVMVLTYFGLIELFFTTLGIH